MCKKCGCNMTNPKDPGFGKGPKNAKASDSKKKAPAKKK
jgi:hypothetical protein